jgi:hypothetical protein
MIFTTVRLERPEGTVLLRGIAVQIEAATASERLDAAGSRPYDLVWLYTIAGVPALPLRRRDVLYDESNNDPETTQSAKYRIVGAVETFENDHQEALCERVVGG